jgi:hypothetical protein
MKDKKVFFKICLLVLTAVSCTTVSRIFFAPSSNLNPEPTLYSLNDALTLANQTIQAGSRNTITLIPSTNTLVDIHTPEPSNVYVDNQIPILGEHHVAFGETFSCIGRGYGVLPKAIAGVNGKDLLTDLEVGEVLKIPAVQWTNITEGPVCPPQFAPPNWSGGTTEQLQPTKKHNEEANATEPPSNATEPPSNATEPPSNETEPPPAPPIVIIPQCPPFCLNPPPIFTFEPPPDPQPGPSEPPPTP